MTSRIAKLAFAAISALGITFTTAAHAAPVPALGDSLNGSYSTTNGWGNSHGLWFANLFANTPGGSNPTKGWNMLSGSIQFDGTTLTATGSTQNNGDASLFMDYS